MKFNPEKYSLPDNPMEVFIDPDEIWEYLKTAKADKQAVRDIIQNLLISKD